MPRRVLLVCSGNTCRSAMAEVMMRNLATEWVVESAGVAAADGEPAADNAIAALAEMGLDLSGHRARRLTLEMVLHADTILAMERRHLERILEMDPSAAPRARTLAESDIADPFGGSIEAYRRARDQIQQAITANLAAYDRGGR